MYTDENGEIQCTSHLTQVSGLKCHKAFGNNPFFVVSPYTGEWIEIIASVVILLAYDAVSPYTGEWIEIDDVKVKAQNIDGLTLHR